MRKNHSGRLTHLDERGKAVMVDVGGKPLMRRKAVADGFVKLGKNTLSLLKKNDLKKGDVLAVARLAGIQAAKQTQNLIPLCHQVPLSSVSIEFKVKRDGILVRAQVGTIAQTGVEMEALTAVAVSVLTIYDMCKAVDREMVIGDIRLVSKIKTPIVP